MLVEARYSSRAQAKRDFTTRAFHKALSRMILRFTVPEVTFPESYRGRKADALRYRGVGTA